MNKKIKFEKKDEKSNNTISYNIVNGDLKRLEDWQKMRKEIVFNINQLTFLNESNTYIKYGINEINERLKEMLDIMDLIIKTERENIIYRCPKMANYL